MTKNKKQKPFAAVILNACAVALIAASLLYSFLVRFEHPELTETQLLIAYHWKSVALLVVAILYYLFAEWLSFNQRGEKSNVAKH